MVVKSKEQHQVVRAVQKKNRKKRIRVVGQIIFCLTVIAILIKVIVFPKEYVEPDKKMWMQTEGFIALSYVGVARTANYQLVSKEQLNSHLQALYDAGYITINTEDIVSFYENGTPLPEKALYIMFEDGRKDSMIFAENILRKYNYCATMMNYAYNVVNKDEIFVKPKELQRLNESGYWDIGTNGFRFSYINVQKKKNIEDIDKDGDYNKEDFLYNHYLMDYIRDVDGLSAESINQMTERIDWDYQAVEEIYTEAIGYVPKGYTIMHAGELYNKMDHAVAEANLKNIYKLFKIMFNEEGSCYNNQFTNKYDLTRMQVDPDWSANRLLLEISNYTDSKTSFNLGDAEALSRWEVQQGIVNIEGNDMVLTSEKSGKARVMLKGSDGWNNVKLTVTLAGRETGSQQIYLRNSTQDKIKLSIKNHFLTITEIKDGSDTKILYEGILPGAENFQEVNDTFDPERIEGQQNQNLIKENDEKILDSRGQTMASGLNQLKWKFKIMLNDDELFVTVNNKLITNDGIPIDPKIQGGRIGLECFSEDEAYDGVFTAINIEPIIEESIQ